MSHAEERLEAGRAKLEGSVQREHGGGVGWEQLVKWRKKLRLGDVLRVLHPGQEFVTYRANGTLDSHTKKRKKIAT